jgi:DUF1680 family protein
MGSRHQDEGFGDDWELPADRAYCETCSGVGSIMLAWRLHLATGEARYSDLIERTLFNVVATSPSADGRSFFYANTLHQREAGTAASEGVNGRAEGGTRAPWFDVSCCPTNVARTLASLGSYLVSTDDEGISVLQYAAGEIRAGGFTLQVETDYPAEGRVRVRVLDAPEEAARLRLRVPSWAEGATLQLGEGERMPVRAGWADTRRSFRPGDTVTLDIPTAPRLTWPDPRIDGLRDTVAVERGPLVLCLESTDLPDGAVLDQVRIESASALTSRGDGAIAGGRLESIDPVEGALPYGPVPVTGSRARPIELTFVPYHRWAERGPASMRVFVPVVR